ncbi:hypothetical protein BH24CHL4_BH24CHL4_08860 [soil metagenome]
MRSARGLRRLASWNGMVISSAIPQQPSSAFEEEAAINGVLLTGKTGAVSSNQSQLVSDMSIRWSRLNWPADKPGTGLRWD